MLLFFLFSLFRLLFLLFLLLLLATRLSSEEMAGELATIHHRSMIGFVIGNIFPSSDATEIEIANLANLASFPTIR